MSAIKLMTDGASLFDNDNNIVCHIDRSEFSFSEDAELAAELARRWNCHQELLEALEAVLRDERESVGAIIISCDTLASVRAALAKAK